MPLFAKTNPNFALSDAIRTSIGSVIVTPTPTADPFIAAMMGFLKSYSFKVSIPPVSLATPLTFESLLDQSNVFSP